MRSARIAALTIGLLGVGAALSACTTTTNTCTNDDCRVSLNGSGASTEVGSSGYLVSLQGADGETAEFSVDGNDATCSEGETVEAGNYSATCTEVGDDSLVVEITPG